jgi:hypothetical protein
MSCWDCGRRKAALAQTRHGQAQDGNATPEYKIWQALQGRCSNPNNKGWEDYAGRGIRVCDRWRIGEGGKSGFECFFDDMGPRPSASHSIDRIDNDGPYSPENCRWATSVEQQNNKRDNHLLTIDGREQSLTQWSHEAGISPERLYRYINRRGYSPQLVAFYIRNKIAARL